MIDRLNGMVKATKEHTVVLETGPISFAVSVPATVGIAIGAPLTLFTYLHWSAEQGPSLFGFQTEFDRTVFLLVTDCSGVGPRLGLAILAHLGAAGFVQAIKSGNDKMLSQVSGIGAKKAEQILVFAKHKIDSLLKDAACIGMENAEMLNDLTQALTSLNYSRPEIAHALKHVSAITSSENATYTFDQLLRQALSFLAKNRATF